METRGTTDSRGVKIVHVLLVVIYGLAAPVTAVLEFHRSLFSQRFDIPPALLYLASLVQAASVALLLTRRHRFHAACMLTAVTIVSIGGHLRIGSPQTALGALVFTVIQVWYARRVRASSDPGGC